MLGPSVMPCIPRVIGFPLGDHHIYHRGLWALNCKELSYKYVSVITVLKTKIIIL